MKKVTLSAGVPVKLDISSGVLELQNQGTGDLLVTDSEANASAGVGFLIQPKGLWYTADSLADAGWVEVWVAGAGDVCYRRVGA